MSFGSLEGANIYFGLLGGAIASSGALDTLLANQLTLGRFKHLVSVNNKEYRNILEADTAVKAVLKGSVVWNGLYILNSAFFFDNTTDGAFIQSFSSGTWSSGLGASASNLEGTFALPDLNNQKSIVKSNRGATGELSQFSHSTKTFTVLAATTYSYYASGSGVFNESFGYIAGGRTDGSTSSRNDIRKFTFASQTSAANGGGNLSEGSTYLHGSQTDTHGFWFSGNEQSSPYSAVNRINKATDATNSQTNLVNENYSYGVGKKDSIAYIINGVRFGGNSRVDSYNMVNFTQSQPAASTLFSGGCAAIENTNGSIRIQRDSSSESYTYTPSTNTFSAAGNAPSSLSLNNSGVSYGAA